jgi:alpha-tubulin suppressor-like RCC1 family protein
MTLSVNCGFQIAGSATQNGGDQGGPFLLSIVDVAVCCGMTQDESSCDYGASYALDSAHNVWAWGSGTYGKLGQGNETNYLTPVKVQSLQNIITISAGNQHVLALDNQGYVWAWGKNYYGQLGNGKSAIDYQSGLEYQSQPVQVMRNQSTPLTNIVYIDAGFEHSLAIDKDGQIWVWGRNEHSELGLGGNYYHQNQKYAIQVPMP